MKRLLIPFLALLSPSSRSFAGCCALANDEAAFAAHQHVAEARVTSVTVVRAPDQSIRTRYEIVPTEVFKGNLPSNLILDTPGGTLDGEVSHASNSLTLEIGKSYVLHLIPPPAGEKFWSAFPFARPQVPAQAHAANRLRGFYRGGARHLHDRPALLGSTPDGTSSGPSGVPGSVVTPTGYMENGGVPSRYIQCDAAIPIRYLVDVDPTQLPTGMTTAAALQSVADVLAVWSSASSLRFHFAGQVSFGQAASNVSTSDGMLRIQLHDNFNAIASTSTLGIGGGSYTTGIASQGGVVAGQTFQKRTSGYVVLNDDGTGMQNIPMFSQVLTHEIGHALGLTHSSENANEPNAILKEATMYYRASNDGRGAAIKVYDDDRIKFGYPVSNTPPFSMSRLLYVVTGSPQPTGAGVDRITIQSADLQTTNGLTLSLVPNSASGDGGNFSLSGNSIIFTPNASYGSDPLSLDDIQGGTYYDRVFFQISDGVHFSAAYPFIISGYHYDQQSSDGLPNSWLQIYFGSGSPGAVGTPRHPDSDPDLDGLSNRVERYLGTNPNNAASGPAGISFDIATRSLTITPIRGGPYEIESSTNLGNWTRRRLFSEFSSTPTITLPLAEDAALSRNFYRAKVTP